jgi:hypothetical protein
MSDETITECWLVMSYWRDKISSVECVCLTQEKAEQVVDELQRKSDLSGYNEAFGISKEKILA